MDSFRRIQDYEHLKTLSDPRRMAILKLLMAEPATLTQLGEALSEHPALVRHHLKQLEKMDLVEMVNTRVVRGFVEKYYRAKAHAFLFQEIVLPATNGRETIVMVGSHDLAMEALASQLHVREHNPVELLILPVGSLEGLIALRQGIAQVAGCHLLDAPSGEYNLPYIRHLFPDRDISLVTMAYREQGLLLPPGNPMQIQNLSDLWREDVMFVNRNRGSGTRLWLDNQLEKLSLPTQELRGYNREVRTHTAVAEMVSQKKANVGIGLRAAAQKFNLDFIPLFEERYDLALPHEQVEESRLRPLFDFLSGAGFRQLTEKLGGYQTEHTGELLHS
jgi:molybdate-binding protein